MDKMLCGTITLEGVECSLEATYDDAPWRCACGYFNIEEELFCHVCRLSKVVATVNGGPVSMQDIKLLELVMEDGGRLQFKVTSP